MWNPFEMASSMILMIFKLLKMCSHSDRYIDSILLHIQDICQFSKINLNIPLITMPM